MISILRTAKAIVLSFSLIFLLVSPGQANTACVQEGKWLDPASQQPIEDNTALERIKASPVILMGEHHQNPFHHQWHLEWLKRLSQTLDNFEVALEMLPVQSQPIIDRWLADEISDQEFIHLSGWDDYWAHDVNLYLPVLKFAKQQGIPLHAINVSKQLFRDVSLNGWDAILTDQREGITDPGPASRPYLLQLARSFRRHRAPAADEISRQEGEQFKRFIEVQLLWDRAMAEGIARIKQQEHKPVVLAIMGSGHMMNGFGTPLQLRHMNINEFVILVPWDDHLDCGEIKPGFADLIYGPPRYARDDGKTRINEAN
jgi:uncharacterized iron-regulated protein